MQVHVVYKLHTMLIGIIPLSPRHVMYCTAYKQWFGALRILFPNSVNQACTKALFLTCCRHYHWLQLMSGRKVTVTCMLMAFPWQASFLLYTLSSDTRRHRLRRVWCLATYCRRPFISTPSQESPLASIEPTFWTLHSFSWSRLATFQLWAGSSTTFSNTYHVFEPLFRQLWGTVSTYSRQKSDIHCSFRIMMPTRIASRSRSRLGWICAAWRRIKSGWSYSLLDKMLNAATIISVSKLQCMIRFVPTLIKESEIGKTMIERKQKSGVVDPFYNV